jgi:hypothetical protein
VTKLKEHQASCHCRPNNSEAPKLFCFCTVIFHYFTFYFNFFLIIVIIAKQNLQFGLEFITEIVGAALLGGISAMISLGGNQCDRFCGRQGRKGRLGSLLGGVRRRVDDQK